ncbi:MAG: DUF456 domain-containing protein [bacterium]|nr:DUF456 domain-containing protein [bacterium]
MIGEIILVLIVFALFAVGFLGMFLPFLPGVPLAWLGFFIYAYSHQFEPISLTTVLVFLGLTIITLITDIVAPLIGAKRYHASKFGFAGSSLGLIVGIIALGPLGIIIGPFIGAFIGEIAAGRRASEAAHSAIGTFIGFLAGSMIKLLVIMVMLGFFIVALF